MSIIIRLATGDGTEEITHAEATWFETGSGTLRVYAPTPGKDDDDTEIAVYAPGVWVFGRVETSDAEA